MTRSHEEIMYLLGPAALDAVDEQERREVERHLEGCSPCREEHARHLESATVLATEERPPDRLWEGIREEIREDRGARARPLPQLRPLGMRIAAGLAAAAMVATGVLAWRVIDLQGRLDDRGGLGAAAQRAAEDPASVRVPLSSGAGDLTVEAVVLPDGSGYLRADPLPVLPGHRTYQLWAVLDDRVISAGVLGPDPAVVAFAAPPQTVALAVTEEQRGGVVSSSRPPVVVGEIRAA